MNEQQQRWPYHILLVQTHHLSAWNISWYDTAL